MFTSGLSKFKGLMGIEHQDSSLTFKRNQSKLLSIEEEILMEQVHRNRVEELSLAKNQQSTLYVGEKPRITVKIDVSWSKAGFTSNFGFVVVLSSKTGKALDYIFKSKYCNSCNMQNDSETVPIANCSVSS